MPDLQQDARGIFLPLMIPESQFFNVIFIKPLPALPVILLIFWRPVLKAIQLNRQLRQGAIKVQKIFPRRMLPAKFETCKPPGAEGAPKSFFLLGLLSAKPARIVFRIHSAQTNATAKENQSTPLPDPLPFRSSKGEGTRRLADIFS